MKKAVLLTILTLSGFGVFATDTLELVLELQSGETKLQSALNSELFEALEDKNLNRVEQLLKKGADPNAEISQSEKTFKKNLEELMRRSPYETAFSNDFEVPSRVPITQILEGRRSRLMGLTSPSDYLYDKLTDVDYKIAEVLIEHGADPNRETLMRLEQAINIRLPYTFIYFESPSFLRRLLKLKPISEESIFSTLLYYALRHKDYKTLKALMEHNPKYFTRQMKQSLERVDSVREDILYSDILYSDSIFSESDHKKVTKYLKELEVIAKDKLESSKTNSTASDTVATSNPCGKALTKNKKTK